MPAPPNRRWFRFSLLTMFAVVTVAAIAVGWLVQQTQIVNERKRVVHQLEDAVGSEYVYRLWAERPHVRSRRLAASVRQALGMDDKKITRFVLPESLDFELKARVAAAYPDADIEFASNHAVWIYEWEF